MIRLADIHDIENIYRLIQKTIQIAYLDHYSIEAVTFFKNHHSIDSISKRLVQGEVLLIKERGKVVATGSLVGSEISGVFVDPDNQGQGLGQKVMHQLEVIAEKHGVVELVLDVSLPSKEFYERQQYEIVSFQYIEVGGNKLNYWKAVKALTPHR